MKATNQNDEIEPKNKVKNYSKIKKDKKLKRKKY